MSAEAAILRGQLAAMKKERDLFAAAILSQWRASQSCPWCGAWGPVGDFPAEAHAKDCVVLKAIAARG